MFGIAGAVLMLVPLAYTIANRAPFLHDRITAHVSLQTLMTLHVYSGILGPLLAIIHTGHKYDSWLGITLTDVMLLVVVSGFVVRYLLTYVNQEIRDNYSCSRRPGAIWTVRTPRAKQKPFQNPASSRPAWPRWVSPLHRRRRSR